MTLASTAKGDTSGSSRAPFHGQGQQHPRNAPVANSRIRAACVALAAEKREAGDVFLGPVAHAHGQESCHKVTVQSQKHALMGSPHRDFRTCNRGGTVLNAATIPAVTEQRGVSSKLDAAGPIHATNTSSSVSVAVQRQAATSFAQPQEVVANLLHGPSMKSPSARSFGDRLHRPEPGSTA